MKISILRWARYFLVAAAFLIIVHRLPAPITEIPETPTPTPPTSAPTLEEQTKPKKSSAKPKAKPAESEAAAKTPARSSSPPTPSPTPVLQGAARFAGVWSGSINQGLTGHVIGTFTVSPDATSVQISQNFGGGTREATMNGNTISWRKLGGTASFTLNEDGQTAQVTLKGLLGSTTATLRRGSAPATTAPSTTQEKPATALQASTDNSSNGFVALLPSGSMSGPRPESPPEARDQHLSGRGIFLLHFDKPTGNIIDVTVSQSTGSAILDQAAIATLRQWRATPNCPREVPMTITFTSSGVQQ
jgi:TonB family protein